ncbi:MAG: glycosyltransferase family 4 protein [Bifidobacteriaceae bacterium]|jgi:glycosyltransferase involved in cell wall biosynthesis|nr:glycosyltransferase family 4 protein [Bifidobacteriaceae bacterium]
MKTPPRIVLMPGNNALIDARVMKNLRAAAALGYDAIALGISRGESIHDEVLPTGGRVIVQPITLRDEARKQFPAWRFSYDRTERSIARAYVKYLVGEVNRDAQRAARDATRQPTITGPHPRRPGPLATQRRRLHALVMRVIVKARSLRADREIKRDAMDPVKLEAWRRRRFALLRLTPWRARWRAYLPKAVDEMIDIGPRLDELEPDIVHVHDVYLMAAAARYAQRAHARGHPVRLVYDAHEFVAGLTHVPPKRVVAYSRMEREFIGDFDRVVTVSDSLADLLVQAHHLARRPDVVLNAPILDTTTPQVPSVRQAAGVAPGVPLLVYSGVVNPARGVGTAVEALPLLEGAHLALIVNNRGTAVRHLEQVAAGLGVADRLHLVPFVPHDQVVRYMASADVGLSPLSHAVNHDVALTNKFCEYIEAGLAVVTSDTPEQARLVRELDLGEVFVADDAADLARAVRLALERRVEIGRRIQGDSALLHRFSWAAQAEVLARVYADELAVLRDQPPGAGGESGQ